MRMIKKMAAGLLASAAFATAPASAAVTFNLIENGPGVAVGTQARLGFEVATAYWSSVLNGGNNQQNITINLRIGFNPLGPGIVGSTGSALASAFVDSTYQSLGTSGNSAADALAFANLPTLGASVSNPGRAALSQTVEAYLDPNAGTGINIPGPSRLDNDGSANNTFIRANWSTLRALGIAPGVDATVDGDVQFSSNFSFDFNPTDGIAANAFDFVGVAIHEIGHALGFRSAVDIWDINNGFTGDPDNFSQLSPTLLDLFRRTAPGGGVDLSVGGVPYFSLDGGVTNIALFSTGRNFGDGRQASHWKDNLDLGIMDPTVGFGEMLGVEYNDLLAMDVIGYNLTFQPGVDYDITTDQIFRNILGVPEPATWGMMLLGFGLVGSAYRRRRTRVAFAAA